MNLKSISDAELLLRTQRLAFEERRITLEILAHLQEIEARLLHAKEGFPSLFAYCTEVLGYSETSALRRIDAARLLKSVPSIAEKVECGDLKLSQLAQVQGVVKAEKRGGRILRADDKIKLLSKVVGQSARETERTLLSLSPALQASKKIEERVRVITEDFSELKIPADRELLELLNQVKGLMACPQEMNPSIAKIFKAGLKVLLAQKKKQKQGIEVNSPLLHGPASPPTSEVREDSEVVREVSAPHARYIPVSLKRAIHARANGKCEYIGPQGNRCENQHGLELHHHQNYAWGGSHTLENLAIYCHAHNAAQARIDFPWLRTPDKRDPLTQIRTDNKLLI